MSLEAEVNQHRKSIRTDGYPMSVGELAAMYKENEIELHPEFQRFFRWTDVQKTRLLESLLLGIPIPSVFVHQRSDGVWDVVDGLQRLSSIFQAMGILRGADGELLPPLQFLGTSYLPALDGKTWGLNDADPSGIGGVLRRVVKRSKLDIKIVLRESDADTKLELFQRLNTGGSPLSGQELRNCQILMVNPDVVETLRAFADFPPFQSCVALSDRNLDEQYDVELVVRFITLRNYDDDSMRDLGPFLDAAILQVAGDPNFDWDKERVVFERTFEALEEALSDNACRRYKVSADRFLGGFLLSAFEVLALGLGHHFGHADTAIPNLRDKAKKFWVESGIPRSTGGRRANDRLRATLRYGRELIVP